MILAFDIGNTNITVGVYSANQLCMQSRLYTDSSKTCDEYSMELINIFSRGNFLNEVEGAIISSVVPDLTQTIASAVKSVAGVDALIVSNKMKTGLKIKIDNAESLGADIIAGGVAALKRFKNVPRIVIDLGTATTMMVIDAKNQMIGGCIIPGLKTSLGALSKATALLNPISLKSPSRVIGKNTEASMQSGIIFGTAAMLDGMCDRIEDELGMKCKVILTGGLARHLINHCHREIIFCENLLLDGLAILYQKNSKT